MTTEFLIMCPRCMGSTKKAVAQRLGAVLKEARAEEPSHVECRGEVWVVRSKMDSLEKGTPTMWRPSGEVFGWKDTEPEPLVIALPDASAIRLRFPLDNSEPIIEHGRPIGLN